MPAEHPIAFTARDYESALVEMRAHVQRTRPDLFTDFTESSLGLLLLEMIAATVDVVSFGIDQAVAEALPATATRRDSLLRFAYSIGYAPRGASPATAVLRVSGLPQEVIDEGGTIAAETEINATYPFYLESAVTIAAQDTFADITVSQIKWVTETAEPSQRPGLSVRTQLRASQSVAQGQWRVYVGAVDPANLWEQVTSVQRELSASKTYEAFVDDEGRLVLTFGDGIAGMIPDDVIRIQYGYTYGSRANGFPSAGTAIYVPVTSGLSNAFNVRSTVLSVATGGVGAESVAELRRNIPGHLRSQGRLTTIADFDNVQAVVPQVALSYADIRFASYRGNVVDVHVWEAEDVTFTGESVSPPRQSATAYRRYVSPTVAQAAALKALTFDYLKDRTLTNVLPAVITDGVAYVDLYLGTVKYDRWLVASTLHAAITSAIVAVFEGGDGFSVKLADIYAAAQSVAGVRQANIQRIVFEENTPTQASGTVVLSANPADGDYVTIDNGTTSVTFEFDDDASASVVGSVLVTIGGSSHETMVSLVSAILANLPNILAAKTSATTATAAIKHRIGGVLYNHAITKSGANVAVTGLAGGSDTVTAQRTDYRANPVLAGTLSDPYPEGTYTPGAPFTGTAPWASGGIAPYYELSDLESYRDRLARKFYDEALAVNMEINYTQPAGQPQALVLRRLVFELEPQ